MNGLSLPGIETLIAKGRRSSAGPVDAERWLLERFGVARQNDWPAAPYCLLSDGRASDILPGEQVWMRADPVHLRVEGGELPVIDARGCSVTREEADSLARDINHHFADSFTLFAPHAERWYMRLSDSPDMETSPLASACGRPVYAHLPRGPHAIRWQAAANELQMLLHEHAVNTAREVRGQAAINSLWFWGAGRYVPPTSRPYRLVLSNDPLARGLALASGAASVPLAEDGGAWLRGNGDEGNVLVVLDTLRPAANLGDAAAWRERISGLDSNWFQPLVRALRERLIGMVSLYLLGSKRTLHVETIGLDLRRFWQRTKAFGLWAA